MENFIPVLGQPSPNGVQLQSSFFKPPYQQHPQHISLPVRSNISELVIPSAVHSVETHTIQIQPGERHHTDQENLQTPTQRVMSPSPSASPLPSLTEQFAQPTKTTNIKKTTNNMNSEPVKPTLKRQLEIEAYSSVVSAFRAQGELTWKKESVLQELRALLKVSEERHRMEMKRAFDTVPSLNEIENDESEEDGKQRKKQKTKEDSFFVAQPLPNSDGQPVNTSKTTLKAKTKKKDQNNEKKDNGVVEKKKPGRKKQDKSALAATQAQAQAQSQVQAPVQAQAPVATVVVPPNNFSHLVHQNLPPSPIRTQPTVINTNNMSIPLSPHVHVHQSHPLMNAQHIMMPKVMSQPPTHIINDITPTDVMLSPELLDAKQKGDVFRFKELLQQQQNRLKSELEGLNH